MNKPEVNIDGYEIVTEGENTYVSIVYNIGVTGNYKEFRLRVTFTEFEKEWKTLFRYYQQRNLDMSHDVIEKLVLKHLFIERAKDATRNWKLLGNGSWTTDDPYPF